MSVQKAYRLGVILAVGLFLNALVGLANLFLHPKPALAQEGPGVQRVIIVGCSIPVQSVIPGSVTAALPVYVTGQAPGVHPLTVIGHQPLIPAKPK